MIVVHAMAEWYSKAVQEDDSEHSRLSRILDVAQDLVRLFVDPSSKPLSYFVIGDEGCIGPSGKLLCLCQTPKNYSAHALHYSIHV